MKKILSIIITVGIILTMCGCKTTYDNDTPNINIAHNKTELGITNYGANGYEI